MSLIKKADVKPHVSRKTRGIPLLFKSRSQPDATGYSEIEAGRTRGKALGSSAGTDPDGAVVPSIVEKR